LLGLWVRTTASAINENMKVNMLAKTASSDPAHTARASEQTPRTLVTIVCSLWQQAAKDADCSQLTDRGRWGSGKTLRLEASSRCRTLPPAWSQAPVGVTTSH